MRDFLPARKRSIADEITSRMLEQILGGEFEPGDRLPAERDLAARFETNRNTLREAIRNLETLNVVEARQGDGLRVRDVYEVGEVNLLPFYLRYAGNLETASAMVSDMLRLRRTLLSEVCGLLSDAPGEGRFERLRSLVEKQRGQRNDAAMLVRTDMEIALELVAASGSVAYRWIFNTMAKLYQEVAYQAPQLWVFPDDYEDTLLAIIEAAEAGSGARARELMLEHLERVDEEILVKLKSLGSF
jgi:GntR family transcriptional regulator, transcriptional repressor for pyruvate dehydrogenase complex